LMASPTDDPDRAANRSPPSQASDELRRINRILETLSAGHRTLLRATDEQQLLADMCRVIVEVGGYRLAWVGYAQHDAQKSVRLMAYAGAMDPAAMRLTWADTDWGRGPTGTAIRSGQANVARSSLTDPDLAPWRERALEYGYASISSLPLSIEGEVVGALTICAAEVDAFDERELQLLRDLADDLAFGVAAMRTRHRREDAEAAV